MEVNLLSPYFIILNLSFVLTLFMLIFTATRKDKGQLHYIFVLSMSALLIWELGHLLEIYWRAATGVSEWGFVYLYFLGVVYIPPFMMFLGIIYNKRTIGLKPKYLLAFIPSTVMYIFLVTSKWHNLFLIQYSTNREFMFVGPVYWVHNTISYIFILIGLFYVVYTSLKSSGFFSRQSILMLLAVSFPFLINILISFNIVSEIPLYMTPVSFSITIMIFAFSILRFDFLNVMPFALKNVFDQMTDGVIILNDKMLVIDFNEPIKKLLLSGNIELKRNIPLGQLISEPLLTQLEKRRFYSNIANTIATNEKYSLEKTLTFEDSTLHISIEANNVITKNTYYCTILLIKDITKLKNQMTELKRNQEILREQERLASLGNLIGGIAHNLKTPIMTISGVSKTLEALGEEYRDSIDDPEVTKEDHKEIANEIIEWSQKVSPYCSYMSEMISAVKGQAVQLSTDSNTIFTLYELISRINILMKFELKKYHCELKQDLNTSIYTELRGDLSILVQVFNNIITNAIQSYNGKEGRIDFKISSYNGRILFVIEDQGVGIPENIKSKLFREMVTTKGKDGTGLGMYMAYSTIRGHFNGTLTFESEEGKGTSFFIEIPIYKEVADATQ